MSLPSTSTHSLNDIQEDCPRPVLGKRAISLPRVKTRLRSLRPEGMKRQKASQEATTRSANLQHQQDAVMPAMTQLSISNVEEQATILTLPRESHLESPARKRDIVQQWLDRQARRFEGLRQELLLHRDSMFDGYGIEKKLKKASRNANATVLGPHGERIPQFVVDTFFTLYPAGGSDWRNSARWEKHLQEFFDSNGFFKSKEFITSADYSAFKEHTASLAAQQPSRRSPSPSTSPRSDRETNSPFFLSLWSRRSSKERQDRGKSPALHTPEEPPSPRAEESPSADTPAIRSPASSKGGIRIVEDPARVQQGPSSPVQSTCVSKPIDPSQIPVPAVPDLKPPSSEGIDLHNLAHATGRPCECCILYLLQFPLVEDCSMPPAPQLMPERRLIPPPEMPQLAETLQVSSPDSLLFDNLPVLSAGAGATNTQRWQSHPLNIPQTAAALTADDEAAYFTVDNLSHDGSEMPTVTQSNNGAIRATTGVHHRHAPAPGAQFLFTPPDSRQNTPPDSRRNSNASQDLSHTTHSAMVLPPTDRPAPVGPADRDWATCAVSDRTVLSQAEQKKRHNEWWAEFTERYGPGTGVWR